MLFGRLINSSGPIVVGPHLETVLVDDGRRSETSRRFVPALSVAVESILPQLGAKTLHLMYSHPSGKEGASCFRVGADGSYAYLGDFSECDDDYPVPSKVSSWFASNGTVVPVDVPAPAGMTAAERTAQTWWYAVARDAGKRVDPALEPLFIFGGDLVNWCQNDETPHDEDGKPMTFIGQVDFSLLSADFGSLVGYLFFDPKTSTAAQIVQIY